MKRIAALLVACFFCFASLAFAQNTQMQRDKPVQKPILETDRPPAPDTPPAYQDTDRTRDKTMDKYDKTGKRKDARKTKKAPKPTTNQ